ncbi:MAG: ATP-binding protein [Lachnospiraceae bacterium]|nr:ATP-binding protein [Lachnospiraceae bacterium]MCI9471561.1 ATP-binding protein [Lachnospiraceae bacterium]
MLCLLKGRKDGFMDLTEQERLFYDSMHGLVEMAGFYGFYGNLWHDYLTFLLVNKENAFSMACEIVGPVEGSINEIAKGDFAVFKELYECDLEVFDQELGSAYGQIISDYQNVAEGSRRFNRRIRDRICSLSQKLAQADSVDTFMEDMVEFYRDFGVGTLGLHKAFRVGHDGDGQVVIQPITNIAHVHLDDLVGYEIAKKKLIDNTEAFVEGRKANNCLLFGDAGTGKSSSIKAILNQYYEKGLRIIEVYKHQFRDLNEVIAQIKNRNYKFIIYMDDLSFEDFEIEYKYLKAIIEGGLEKKPENVLIYATSNRRHLIRENFEDKEGRREDLHASDTVQEKLSLVSRFGVTIFFSAPNKKEFQNIVSVLAKRHQIEMPEEELLLEANKWELSHGGLTGRTAQQFIDYLLGQKK